MNSFRVNKWTRHWLIGASMFALAPMAWADILTNDAQEMVVSSSDAKVVNQPWVLKELKAFREKLQKDPASLDDIIQWKPVMDDGQLQGMRITDVAKSSLRLFYGLKLRRQDIVTSINGMPLSEPGQQLALQQEMTTASEMSLSVLRNGQPLEITIQLKEDK